MMTKDYEVTEFRFVSTRHDLLEFEVNTKQPFTRILNEIMSNGESYYGICLSTYGTWHPDKSRDALSIDLQDWAKKENYNFNVVVLGPYAYGHWDDDRIVAGIKLIGNPSLLVHFKLKYL